MNDLVTYIMGVAAKSNIEKRQVGCVIVHICEDGSEVIIGEGFNTKEQHAEWHAVEDMMTRAEIPDNKNLKAYVTHAPCPECARMFGEHGIHKVEVIEQFMKFDSDKLRFDLIDNEFYKAITSPLLGEKHGAKYSAADVKTFLYRCGEGLPVEAGSPCPLYDATYAVINSYPTVAEAEKALARVLTFGASKYKPGNWRKCTDTGRYLAAAHRHNNAILAGEQKDPETGYDHRDHILTNLMFLFVLGLEKN